MSEQGEAGTRFDPTQRQDKAALLDQLRALAALAGEVGMESLRRELVDERLPRLESESFTLVVLGEFNHGKSTFVNALVGAPVLPAGITPTTATINHLVWAAAPRAEALLEDGGRVPVDPTALGEWVTVDGKQVSRVKRVEIGWPAELLRERLTLVDTPGVNDINEQRAEITYGYIPKADAVIFLLDGAQVLKQSERAFLEERILRRSRDKLIFVLGKTDLLSPDEREEALAYCREHLGRVVPEPVIFPLSAKRALSADPAQRLASGMAPLQSFLGRTLSEERGRILLDNGVSDALRTASYLRTHLGIKRRSLSLDLDELEARIVRVRKELAGTHANLRAHHARIRAESDAIQATVRLDLEEWTRELKAALPREIDRADSADIQRYLQGFLEELWKEWSEAEGDKVAGLLERLAEEIIQVTNEDVESAMATLTRELGPADARLGMNVDTLKYDVGLFAIGALGTGIFLFVNTLVGGLLTLAAPLIAVLVRERLAGSVKESAKAAVAPVIDQAAAAVLPRFVEIVEQFQSRLTDFVTAAGVALHQGISEVLDRALAERRSVGADVSTRTQELDAQLGRLSEIGRLLEAQRERLWASSTSSTGSQTSSAG
jgi:ribosome biogenesis GTPase A